MFEAQRQGRISFYMVSAGEEGSIIGSAAALEPDDIITCQYRETGVFQQRGFTLKDFMSQLTSNKNDPGKGRNMPVHYSGKLKTGVVSLSLAIAPRAFCNELMTDILTACRSLDPRYTNPPCHRCSLCAEDACAPKSHRSSTSSGCIFRRRSCKRGRLPRSTKHRSDPSMPCHIHLPQQRFRHLYTHLRAVPRRRHRQPRCWVRNPSPARRRH